MKNIFAVLTFCLLLFSCTKQDSTITAVQERISSDVIIRIGIFTNEAYWEKNYDDGDGIELDLNYASDGSAEAHTCRLDSIGQVLESGLKVKQLFGHPIQYSKFIVTNNIPEQGSVYSYTESEVNNAEVIAWATAFFQSWCDANGWQVIAPLEQKNIYWLKAKKSK